VVCEVLFKKMMSVSIEAQIPGVLASEGGVGAFEGRLGRKVAYWRDAGGYVLCERVCLAGAGVVEELRC